VRVLVQSSSNRCYTDIEFEAAGAEITEDLSPASVIFGVKEVPIENLLPNKTYFFFSHTIKA
jgi:alpha-aminoadipic semialdehyde synthase